MSRLRTRIEIAVGRHGWPVVAAPLVALLAVALYLGALVPAQSSLAAARAELARETRAAAYLREAPPPATQAQHIAQLRAVVNQPESATQLVRRMAALAQAEQVVLQQADYQLQMHGATGVTQLTVTQPVRANYRQLRRYIEAVLRDMPQASLDHLSARRENVAQGQLEVRLRWSIWMGKAP